MKTVFALAAIAVCGSVASAAVVTQWNFNSVINDGLTSTGTTLPFVGSGTASLVGGVTSPSFNAGGTTGIAPASSSDPASTDNSGWQTTNYPAQGTGNKTAGVQFAVNTTNYEDIIITFDVRHSNTSANTLRLQYSTDGGLNFIDANQYTFTPAPTGTGDSWYNRSADLSAIAGVENNANFVFRVVTEFAPSSSGYLAARSTSTYGGGVNGMTLRWDMVTINGTLVPTPGSIALTGLAGLLVARRRRA
jgi:hypothetical protein